MPLRTSQDIQLQNAVPLPHIECGEEKYFHRLLYLTLTYHNGTEKKILNKKHISNDNFREATLS